MIGRVQAQYYSHILKFLRESPGTSRIQLARAMNLDRSSVTNLTNALINKKLIMQGNGSYSGEKSGRRQIPLSINPDFGVVAGIQIQEDCVVSIFTNLAGKLLFHDRQSLTVNAGNLLSRLQMELDSVVSVSRESGYRLLGVGIGITGIVDPSSGLLVDSRPLGIEEPLAILPALSAGRDFPVYIDNDTNSCCWGILAFSPRRDLKNFLYVLVEMEDAEDSKTRYKRMSTGAAFALNGAVYYGDSGSAGEFKSFLCRNRNDDQFSVDYAARLRIRTDPVIRGRFLEELARNIAYLANILNLSHVFLGGTLYSMKTELSALIQHEANINWLYRGDVRLNLDFSTPDSFPVAVGAAGLAVERLFDLPLLQVSTIVQEAFAIRS